MLFTIKRFSGLLLALFALLISSSVITAHGFLVRSIPEDRAVLDRAPTRLQYWFSESLEPRFSTVSVRDAAGQIIAEGGLDPQNATLLRVQLPSDLPDGAYLVDIRPAFASDGHVNAFSQTFFVGETVADTLTSQTQANQNALPLEVVWRMLTYNATVVLFGVFALYSWVLFPAWSNPQYQAGGLPPRVMQRLNWIAGLALGFALGGNILALLQQSMAFFNVGLGEVITQSLWTVVRTGTRFGDLWNVRMILLMIAAGMFIGSLYYRQTNPTWVRAFWSGNAWVLMAVLWSFSAISHAAGSLMLPWVGIFVDWLHFLGVGFWAGGLMALVLVLPPALKPYSGEQRSQAMRVVLMRYSRVALAAGLTVIATGIYSALAWVDRPTALTETSFGGSLLIKLVLVGGMLAFGTRHYLSLNPDRLVWLRTRARYILPLQASMGDMSLRVETGIAAAVLCAAGLLAATPVPVPAYVNSQIPTPSASQIVNGYTITQTITPGGVGVNTYDLAILRDGEPVDGLTVEMQQVYPARDLRSDRGLTDNIGGGLYVSADSAIDRAGAWWTLVDIRDADDTLTRAVFTWDIDPDAAIIQTQPLSVQNGLALVLIGGVLLWMILPALQRLYPKLDLTPRTALITGSAILISVFFLVFSTITIQESQQRYEETLNPPPKVVNTVLPTMDSLTQGQMLFNERCQMWTSDVYQQAYQDLLTLLPSTRDETLYQVVGQGGRGLVPCEPALTEVERWHVVNLLRSRE